MSPAIFFLLLCGILICGFLYMVVRKRIRRLEQSSSLSTSFDVDEKAFRKELKEREALSKEQAAALLDSLEYDVLHTESIERFKPIQNSTHCVFAKTAKVWGCREWQEKKSIEGNVLLSIHALHTFIRLAAASLDLHLDGFLFEVRGSQYTSDIHTFSQTVKTVLSTIARESNDKHDCTKASYIDKRGWCFLFDREPIFVTTFSPCYPSNHARYCFDAPKDSCFILLQPEISFFWRDIGTDTPHTNWDKPATVREKIRCAYRGHGREYDIPLSVVYPPSHGIVPPLHMGEPIVEWWKT